MFKNYFRSIKILVLLLSLALLFSCTSEKALNDEDMAIAKEIFSINGYNTDDINFVDSVIAYWNNKTGRLRSLYIPSDFVIKKYPPSVSRLTGLKELVIDSKNVSTLGNEICSIPNLVFLEFHSPDLVRYPLELGKLTNLVSFKAYNVFADSLPESFSQLNQLKNLYLEGEDLVSIPKQIFDLKGLEKLEINFSDTKLVSVDSSLGKLSTLKSIILSGMITGLPKELRNLSDLEQLVVFGGELSQYDSSFIFPKELYDLTNLTELQLYGCQLHQLPEGIAKLKSLKTLILDSNQLEILPKDIYQMNQWAENNSDNYIFSVSLNSICNVSLEEKNWLIKSENSARVAERWPISQFCK